MDAKIDFQGLAAAVLSRARLLLPDWLPGGAMSGQEYVCAGLSGGPGRSLSVNVNTGKWADFADQANKGGDLISLYAAIHGIKQGEAARELSKQVGFATGDQGQAAKKKVSQITAPPADEATPAMRHPRYGLPAKAWTYRDADGSVLFYVARYDPEGEHKQYAPWCWDADFKKWVSKAWPKPRPLYGLDRINKDKDKPVLLVEGEKSADAVAEITDAYIVASWPGGASAWRQIDWTPLAGRKVLLWPDADRHVAKSESEASKHGVAVGAILPYQVQPGPAAMAGIAASILADATEVKVIKVGIDEARKDGWDAADAVGDGWTWDDVYNWARDRIELCQPQAQMDFQVIDPESPPPDLQGVLDGPPKGGRALYGEWERLGVATTQNGSPICNVDNALRVIEGRDEFKDIVWYDRFHRKYFTRFNFDTWQDAELREWSDVDELILTAFMQRQLGLRRMSDEMVHKAAVIHAHRHVKNEPLDWMESLKWDGESRIEDFFIHCFGASASEYSRAASRNFWIGLAARIYVPGCILRTVVVLEGIQYAGKSTGLSIIGGPWYAESSESVMSPNFYMILSGKLLIEIAELDSFVRAEATKIKQVISCRTDRFRAPYARAAQDNPRQCVFVATTNESTYLKDNTGGTRFWPIKTQRVDLDRIARDREQLFAEAVARFKKGETWHEMPKDATAKEQEDRRQADEWEQIIGDFLRDSEQTTIKDIAVHLKIEIAKLDMVAQKRIGNVLRVIGWEKKTVRGKDGAIKAWRRVGASEQLSIEDQAATPPEEEAPPF